MKNIVNVVLVIAAISLVAGIISRLSVVPIVLGRAEIFAEAFLAFTNTCLLLAIVLILLQLVKSKQ